MDRVNPKNIAGIKAFKKQEFGTILMRFVYESHKAYIIWPDKKEGFYMKTRHSKTYWSKSRILRRFNVFIEKRVVYLKPH